MDIRDIAKLLVRIGAFLGMLLGIFATAWLLWLFVLKIMQPVSSINIFEIAFIIFGAVAITLSYLVYTRYLPSIDQDPFGTGTYFIVFGILIAIGAWGIGGLLIVIGGFLLIVEETS